MLMTLRKVLHVRLSASKAVRSRGYALKLEEGADEAIEAKWVQVAVEGEFLGYGGPDHPGFKFDRAIFEQVVANIHDHPAFKLGADGFGEEGVIPWDFSHASEADPARGTLPLTGAPAQGWSSDAQIRNGAGGAELWMLTKFLEPARTFVLAGQYKWASVALSFESVDPQTGEPTGALVTSIALTNTPFIEGMAQLAATTSGAAHLSPPDNKDAVTAAKETTMDILKALAALLGVGATQEAITAELVSLTDLRDKLVKLFAMAPNKATADAILQSATDARTGAETLQALCTALVVEDSAEAITSVAALQAASAELEKLKPELLELMKVQEAAEAVEVTADVERAIASNSAFDEGMRPMFELSRKTDKVAFLAKYPVGEAAAVSAPVAAELTKDVAATTSGVQLAVVPTVGAAAVTIDAQGNMQRPAVQASAPSPPPACSVAFR